MLAQATGDPLSVYTSEGSLSAEEIARLRAYYGLDQPLPVQYLNWLRNFATGNWGTSYFTQENVAAVLAARLPNTIVLVAVAFAIVLVVGVTLGTITAVRQYSKLDYAVTTLSFVGIAMPSFWLGLLLIIVFSVEAKKAGLPFLPVGGMYDVVEGPSLGQLITHIVMPAGTLAFVVAARYVRYVRASVLDQLNLAYVYAARAKGLRERVVLGRHVLRNALLPLISLVGVELPTLLAGSVVIESIYSWPGMGRLFWTSAQHGDLPVLMAIIMFSAVLTITANLAADIAYGVADPRISRS